MLMPTIDDHSDCIFGDTPPNHIFFQVVVKESGKDESEYKVLRTFAEAMDEAAILGDQLVAEYPKSTLTEVEEEDLEDDYHLFLVDTNQQEILRIGITALDLRGETMH